MIIPPTEPAGSGGRRSFGPSRRLALAASRAGMGVLTLVAIGVQLAAARAKPEFAPANFFGYFTILSNTFAACVFVWAAANGDLSSRRLDVARGAATLCLALVGVVFSFLLANLESDVIPWVNVVVHYLMPLAVVADWIVNPPRERLTARDALLWLAIPLGYVTYTLIRGSIVHWYPYPFLNVDSAGAATVAAYVGAIFIFTSLLGAMVLAGGNALRERRAARRTVR